MSFPLRGLCGSNSMFFANTCALPWPWLSQLSWLLGWGVWRGGGEGDREGEGVPFELAGVALSSAVCLGAASKVQACKPSLKKMHGTVI